MIDEARNKLDLYAQIVFWPIMLGLFLLAVVLHGWWAFLWFWVYFSLASIPLLMIHHSILTPLAWKEHHRLMSKYGIYDPEGGIWYFGRDYVITDFGLVNEHGKEYKIPRGYKTQNGHVWE